ncbi:HD domain-containing protein [Gemmatimonas sp.]|uniref:HD domain-containing protein n=1 Tax=Gemmatimonas sp. TaxID=1962908 RepID=UPI003DA2AE1C
MDTAAAPPYVRAALGFPEPGTQTVGVVCVRARTERTASTGSPYLVVTLGHRDGSATVKVWSQDLPLWADVQEGDALEVRLVAKAGNNGYPPEWTVQEFQRLPADHPVRDDLLPACPISYEELRARYDALRLLLTEPARVLLDVVMEHVGEEAYWRAPAAERMHHAVAPFGLVWHSIEVAEVAVATARAIPTYVAQLSIDALILGALLHDLGKIREYDVIPGVGIRRSVLAESRYHTTLGIEMVATAAAINAARLDAAGVPAWLIQHVYAVIESHHAQKEWGSPSAPSSREAWLLHLADQTSAKLAALTATLERATPMESEGWYRPAEPRSRPLQRFDLLEAQRTADADREVLRSPDTDEASPDDVITIILNAE